MKKFKSPLLVKMKKSLFASVIVSFFISSSAIAAFTSGSDGSDQALNVTEDTVLPMPSDGIFHFTTITIGADATLTFESNVNNTPVYLLATGDVTIVGNVDVSGQGSNSNTIGGAPGPGGFAGGKSGVSGFVIPGDGYGPGGGRAPTGGSGFGGSGSYGTSGQNGSGAGGEIYGSQLLVPLVGGSGGAGSYGRSGGGGGGGAILIASTTTIALSGQIISRGGRGGTTLVDGSGGAIRLVAPDVIGAGELDIAGFRGGEGRARVDMYIKGNTEFNIKCISRAFPRQNCSVSSFMKVFLENSPTLQITKVGEFDVTGNGQYFELPFESEARQAIIIRSNNFKRDITVRVSLTPISGATIEEDFLISKASGSVQDNTVFMDFPLNTSTRVNVWTIPTP